MPNGKILTYFSLVINKTSINKYRVFIVVKGGIEQCAHTLSILLQLDSLKSNSQSQIIKFTTEIDQFYQRWQQEHPPDKLDMTNLDQYLKLLRKSRKEWDELMQNQMRLKYSNAFFYILIDIAQFQNNTLLQLLAPIWKKLERNLSNCL